MKAAGATIDICRAYAATCAAGVRVLVDRVWPCDLSNVALRLDNWIREAATNHWFHQYYAYWSEFLTRYAAEFGHTSQAAERGLVWCVNGPVILCNAAQTSENNNEVVLRDYLIACQLKEHKNRVT